MFHPVTGLARSVISLAAPFLCVVCGDEAGPQAHWPLCPVCSASLLESAAAMARASRCSVCGKPLCSEHSPCMRCRTTSYAFDSACPLWRYDGELRSLVLAYKAGRRSLAGFFAEALASAVSMRFPGRVIVPVPPRPGKLRRKGWDQVEAIVRLLESCHGLTVARILARADGRQQKALDLEARAANMKGKITVKKGAFVPMDPVLLDDVLTTGATLSACAAVLRQAGATRIDAMALAAD